MNKEKVQQWVTRGFDEFSRGKFGNGGQNLYVSKQGVLQRIYQTDVTRNGYVDLVFCNSQNHEEKVSLDVYPDPINNPKKNNKLHIGGANSGCVADLNGNSYEDLIVSCGWDGISTMTNSMIFYGSSEVLNNKYVNYLPTENARCVTTGDFNGNGKKDIVFISDSAMKIFYQGVNGFEPEKVIVYQIKDVVYATTIASGNADGYDTLLMRKKNGAYSIIKASSYGLDISNEEELLKADEDYVQIKTGREDYTQAISEPEPLAQLLEVGEMLYLCAFRKEQTCFYPYQDGMLGKPIVFKCKNTFAVAAGDIKGNGNFDLVFACRDKSTGTECSWIYPGSVQNGWQEDDRIAIKSYHACDVVLSDFTGNGLLDIVICQSHTQESFTSEVLIFPVDEGSCLSNLKAQQLPSHDAYRVFVVNGQLVIMNRRKGSLIGDGDVTVYTGGADGFHSERKISLSAWGCTDMVCCDLNDNGFPDLVLANAAELSPWLDPGSFVYYNSPNGFRRTPDVKLPTKRAHGVVCGDLNHSGYLDLVFCGFDNNILKVFYGSEAGFRLEDSVEIVMESNGKIYKEPRFMVLADLNGNGWLDLVVTMIDGFESFVLWGSPDGFNFDNKQIFHVRHSCNAKVADLNDNGYPDLIFGGHSQSLSGAHDAFVYIYWGSADGFSEDRRTLLPSNAVNSLAVADFNNNGLLDIFVASYQDGRLRDIDSYIYWNQGSEGFLPHKRLPMRTHAVSGNLAADFNGNGWIDLAIGNHKVEGKHISYSTVWNNGPDGFDEKCVTNLPSEGIHSMGNVDPGNIMDRSAHEYYVSKIYSNKEKVAIHKFYCEGEIPEKNNIAIQFRYGETEAELLNCPWRGATGLNSWFNQYQNINSNMFKGKFLQYRLRLSSFNSLNTPRIKAIIIEIIK